MGYDAIIGRKRGHNVHGIALWVLRSVSMGTENEPNKKTYTSLVRCDIGPFDVWGAR